MAKWINTDVKIPDKLPRPLQELIDEMEELDRREDWLYLERADFLDAFTKQFVIDGLIDIPTRNALLIKYGDIYDKV